MNIGYTVASLNEVRNGGLLVEARSHIQIFCERASLKCERSVLCQYSELIIPQRHLNN